MKTKLLTFLLSLTLLFLFSGDVFGDDFQDAKDAYNRQDYKEAFRLILPIAKEGNADAQTKLGDLYYKGQGVPQDYKEAVKWYRLAAKQENATAQSRLGWMYYQGQGVPRDYVLAHMWWNLAGSSGLEVAVNNRNILEKKMTLQQIEKAQEMARNWKPKK